MNFMAVASDGMQPQLAKAIWDPQIQLTRSQRLGLQETLKSFIEYTANPTFETFMDERTNGARYTYLIRGSLAKLSTALNSEATLGTQAPELKIRAVWEKFCSQNEKNGVKWLERVVPETLHLRVEATTNRSIATISRAATECTSVFRSFNSGITYNNNPAMLSSIGRRSVFAEVSFIGQFGPSNRASPIYAVWFWSERDVKWRPVIMLSDAQLRYAAIF